MKFINSRFWNYFLWPLLLTLTLFPFRWSGSVNPHDEGVWLAAAQAIIENKRLYHDVWFQYGPLLLVPVRMAFAFFPPSLSLVRAVFWFCNWIGLIAVYGALLKFVKEPNRRIVLSLFVFMVPAASHAPCIPMAARYGIGFFSLWCWPAAPLAAGALAGVSFFTSQETGIAVFAAGLVFFAMSGGWKRFLIGFAAVIALGFSVIAAFMGISDYLRCTLPGVARLVADQRLPLPRLNLSAFSFSNLADVMAAYLPVLTYAALMFFAWRRRKPALLALALFGFLMLAPAFGRSDRWHIYIAISPLMICAGAWMDEVRNEIYFLMAIVFGVLIFLPPVFTLAARDRTLRENARGSYLPRLGSAHIPDGQASGYEFLGQWMSANTHPKEPVLFYPYNGAFYFLMDRSNPSTYPILSYAGRPEQQQTVVEELKKSGMQWVVWDTQSQYFDGKPVSQLLSGIETYLRENFEPKESLGPLQFWKRKIS